MKLVEVLVKFYPEVRTNNGKLNKKSSLISVRYGLNRYLNNSHGKDIVPDTDFHGSNKLKSIEKARKR